MRRTIQKQTLSNFLFLRGKLIYLVALACSLLFPAQLHISDSAIVTNINNIYVSKLDTRVVDKKNKVSENKKLLKPKSISEKKVIKQIKLKSTNSPNLFYRNNSTTNYFINSGGKNKEAITPTTQPTKWIAFLDKIDLHCYFINHKSSNLIKYKENDTISFFHKTTLARPPPQL
ncbi:hypothetical protein M2254_002526 [Chryseobacterium sp. BIGb0186]|nr:hypothetical protein [Chryseobacterium sp. BIGb0186]